MSSLRERLTRALRDPKVTALLRQRHVQAALVHALRWRGRVEGEIDRRLHEVAVRLNLATQKDVRTLQRRIRYLEQELREAQEVLSDDREAG